MAFRRSRMIAIALAGSLVFAGPAAAADVTLIWTSPGDDGWSGRAVAYDMRYSINLPISESNFYLCPVVPGVPAPQPGGALQITVMRDVMPNTLYFFAIKTVDERGNWSQLSNVAMWVPTQTVSAGDGTYPLSFAAPAPNPARSSTRFALSLPMAARVRVEAFDLSGRRVRTLVDGDRAAGPGDVIWDLRNDSGTPVQAGVYLVRAMLPGRVVTHRTVVVP